MHGLTVDLLQQFALIIRCLACGLPLFHSAAVLCSYIGSCLRTIAAAHHEFHTHSKTCTAL